MDPAQSEAAHALHSSCPRSICTRGTSTYAAPYAALAHGHHDVLQGVTADGVDVLARYDMAIADEAVEEMGRDNGPLGMGRDDDGVSRVKIGDPFVVCE